MTLKEELIANRLSVAFILFIVILVSLAPTVFFGDGAWTIIPLFLALLLVLWYVYSSIVKARILFRSATA